jgi:hypothetical protein
MRQFRPTYGIKFIKPKIKSETKNAYCFELNDDDGIWIPKAWILNIGSKGFMTVKEYWSDELSFKGFKKK